MYYISNIPDNILKTEAALFESRISHAVNELVDHTKEKIDDIYISFGNTVKCNTETYSKSTIQKDDDTPNIILAQEPSYSFDQLILPCDILEKITHKIKLFELKDLVFNKWGLIKIEPHPRSALNFYGPPGTGKTMAAHAIASYLRKKIILASYAEIESKYHGDGPKNVKSIFKQADDEGAILFIDEADSLLSKRLSNVSQGSEQAINSMRSQLLICLEQFSGIVIFSTNFVENYDKAFETRVDNIQFRMPGKEERAKIWRAHLPSTLPVQDDVDIDKLALEVDDVCGRDIKNAVIDAALKAACNNQIIALNDLLNSINAIKKARINKKMKSIPLSDEEKNKIQKRLEYAFKEEKEKKE